MLHDGAVTVTVFREFLQRLMMGADRRVSLVVDGHPIHEAKSVKAYVERLAGRLRLFYLPPYSPHLNPDEQVGAPVKRQVS